MSETTRGETPKLPLLEAIKQEVAADPAGAALYLTRVDLIMRQVAAEKITAAGQAEREAMSAARAADRLKERLHHTGQAREQALKGTPAYAEWVWNRAVVDPPRIPEGPLRPVSVLIGEPLQPGIPAHDYMDGFVARASFLAPDTPMDQLAKDTAVSGLSLFRWKGSARVIVDQSIASAVITPGGSELTAVTFSDPNRLDETHIGEERTAALGQLITAATNPSLPLTASPRDPESQQWPPAIST